MRQKMESFLLFDKDPNTTPAFQLYINLSYMHNAGTVFAAAIGEQRLLNIVCILTF